MQTVGRAAVGASGGGPAPQQEAIVKKPGSGWALCLGALVAATLSVGLSVGPAAAQDYPKRPVTMVVPFAAGGPTDTVARITAEAMSRSLGQQVIVENVVGAGGTIASARVARAEPDGYTILVHHVGMATSATLYRKLSYDPRSSFAAIGLMTEAPMTIVARADFEPNTLEELVAYVKAKGMDLSYANAGVGAASHLCGLLFMSSIQTQMTTVSYKGNGPIMNDLLGKQIDMTCDQTTNTTSQIKGGKIKAYAITSRARLGTLPDLPTADEAGLKGFEVTAWHGLYAPEGTPEAVVARLTQALQAAVADKGLADRFGELGTEPVTPDRATPRVHKAHLEAEIDRWAPIIKAAGQFAD